MTERRHGRVRRAARPPGPARTHEGGGTPAADEVVQADPDAWWFAGVVHTAFFLLWASSAVRLLTRYDAEVRTAWVPALFLVFGVLYPAGLRWAPAPVSGRRPTTRHLVWLGAVLAVWAVLLVVAPSATWCAVPLLFTGLHHLPVRAAVPLAAGLAALVVAAELRLNVGEFNPNIVIAPLCLAAVATAVLVHGRRQTIRQARLIEDLLRTRRDLAAAERRAGVLSERQRLSAEIHDTLAQNLSSQQMLLQAAERLWEVAPERARGHVHDASATAARGLAEARRFVRDLAPLELTDSTLATALRTLAAREGPPGPAVSFRLDGIPGPLPERVEAALLRVAQGALANVREHATATRAVVTLTCVEDRLALDIADNGKGFDVRDAARSDDGRGDDGRSRGHGLDAMRRRARQVGGTFTVDSTPGEGCVVTVSVPVCPDEHERVGGDEDVAQTGEVAGYARPPGGPATATTAPERRPQGPVGGLGTADGLEPADVLESADVRGPRTRATENAGHARATGKAAETVTIDKDAP